VVLDNELILNSAS